LRHIIKKLLFVLVSILFIFFCLFALVWQTDGFATAWQLFFISDTVPAFFQLVGFYDWLIGILVSVAIAGIVEITIGRRLKRKSVRLIVDFSTAIVSFLAYMQIIT